MKLDALVMSGGRGSRMGVGEKPLLQVLGRPMVDIVLQALRDSTRIGEIWCVTTERTPRTEEHLQRSGVRIFRAGGRGYVEDLREAMIDIGLSQAVVVSADLPLITSEGINRVVEEYSKIGSGSLAVVVPLETLREIGAEPSISMGGLVPSGVNVVDLGSTREEFIVSRDLQFAVNVNSPAELELAERLALQARKV